MKENNYIELLGEVIEELEDNKKSLQKDLNKNLNRISEIDVYIKSMKDKEDEDFRFFSPRNFKSVYSEQILICNEEKDSLETENKEYYGKINNLNNLLKKLYMLSAKKETTELNANVDDTIFNETVSEDNAYIVRDSVISQEAERQRIARDLHDYSLQNLTALIHKVELALMYVNQDPIRTKLELSIISNSLKDTINEIREIIFDLRPMTLDDLGFKDLLDSFISKEVEQKGVNVIFDKYYLSVENKNLLIILFRIIKETVCNALKHSKCDEIHISIDDTVNNEIVYDISDNGCGFDVNEKLRQNNKHYGLIILKERVKLINGNINFDSSEGKGTKIHINIPISK